MVAGPDPRMQGSDAKNMWVVAQVHSPATGGVEKDRCTHREFLQRQGVSASPRCDLQILHPQVSGTVCDVSALRFNVVYEDAGEGWVYAHVPELPEVQTQGEGLEQAREMVRDAIAMVLDERRARGELIPEPGWALVEFRRDRRVKGATSNATSKPTAADSFAKAPTTRCGRTPPPLSARSFPATERSRRRRLAGSAASFPSQRRPDAERTERSDVVARCSKFVKARLRRGGCRGGSRAPLAFSLGSR